MVDILCIFSLNKIYGKANITPTAIPAITDNAFLIFELLLNI